ncbi:helix-turn-helix transcriptional regulator [Phenylobacterium sp.]|uniref:AraC family transcriptional regulator n=1 Tax=Phenylobacterium sp. TaxID=1871053 RepID=UPI0025E82184|nr:helix-turn-helix transcriptional regulator [Phenylobacterium sp.]
MSHLPVRQIVEPGALPRHRHAEGYVALVIAGGYEEAGDAGRRRVGAGDVVVHRAFEAHLNRTPPAGAQVLNLPLPTVRLGAFGQVDDLDALVATAAHDPRAASEALAAAFRAVGPGGADWPDLLAAALARGDARPLGEWAADFGLSAEHLSRGFGRVFGVSPQRFRLESRVRAVLPGLADEASLADLAVAYGFADQAHMTRSIRAITGRPPGAWRRSNPFKTTP